VVAYALAGSVDVDLANDPLAPMARQAGVPARHLATNQGAGYRAGRRHRGMFEHEYAHVFDGDAIGRRCRCDRQHLRMGRLSTYIKKPPYFDKMVDPATSIHDLAGCACSPCWAIRDDDHISPRVDSEGHAAGRYLIAQGVEPKDFNHTARAAAIMK